MRYILSLIILSSVCCSQNITLVGNGHLNAPTNGGAIGYILQANLTWEDNSSRETGYEISRDTSGGSSWVVIDTTIANAETYQDSGSVLANGDYKYKIRD